MSRAILTTVATAIALAVIAAIIGCATAGGTDANAERIDRAMRGDPYSASSPAARGISVEPTAQTTREASASGLSAPRYRRYFVPARRMRVGRVDHRAHRVRGAAASVAR